MKQALAGQFGLICARYAIDEIGACDIDALAHADTRRVIRGMLPGAQSVIVLLKKIEGGAVDRAHGAEYQAAARKTFADLIGACADIVACLRQAAVPAVWPGAQRTPHQKNLAVAAGLGAIGDSGLLVSARSGVDTHLETVLAGRRVCLPADGAAGFACDHCGLCVAACPAAAISPAGADGKKCVAYRRVAAGGDGGMIYCGLCMKACPQRKGDGDGLSICQAEDA